MADSHQEAEAHTAKIMGILPLPMGNYWFNRFAVLFASETAYGQGRWRLTTISFSALSGMLKLISKSGWMQTFCISTARSG